MKTILKYIMAMAFLCFVPSLQAQEHEASAEATEHFPYHKVGVALTHVNVSSGIKEAGSRWISLPGFGIDYDYVFSEKWSLGLHTDIIIEKFEVEENLNSEDRVLERNYPIAPAVMVGRKLGAHTILFGAGAEFEESENLFLNRVGYEYGMEISEAWEVELSFNYDFRWNAYDSYILGIVLCRKF